MKKLVAHKMPYYSRASGYTNINKHLACTHTHSTHTVTVGHCESLHAAFYIASPQVGSV